MNLENLERKSNQIAKEKFHGNMIYIYFPFFFWEGGNSTNNFLE